MTSDQTSGGYMAVEYVHNDVPRFMYILKKCSEHRPWFDDWTWEDEELRRKAVIDYLSEAKRDGKLWEVYKGKELVGILLFTDIRYRMDVQCHFVFFDHKLKDKQDLCLSAMGWAFRNLKVHRLSVEIPTYAMALVNFCRKYLGFRYEAEARQFSWPRNAKQLSEKKAELGSRKHQYTYWKRQWHDVLLLSVTRKEFEDFARTQDEARWSEPEGHHESVRPGELRGTDSTTGTTDPGHTELGAQGSETVPSVDSADERSPETTERDVLESAEPADPGDAGAEADITPWGAYPPMAAEPPDGKRGDTSGG